MFNALMVGLGYRESQKQLSNRDLFGDPNSVCDRFKKGLSKLEFKSIVDDLNAKIDTNADHGKSDDLIAHYYLDMLKVSGLARDPEYRPLNELSSDLKKLAKKILDKRPAILECKLNAGGYVIDLVCQEKDSTPEQFKKFVKFHNASSLTSWDQALSSSRRAEYVKALESLYESEEGYKVGNDVLHKVIQKNALSSPVKIKIANHIFDAFISSKEDIDDKVVDFVFSADNYKIFEEIIKPEVKAKTVKNPKILKKLILEKNVEFAKDLVENFCECFGGDDNITTFKQFLASEHLKHLSDEIIKKVGRKPINALVIDKKCAALSQNLQDQILERFVILNINNDIAPLLHAMKVPDVASKIKELVKRNDTDAYRNGLKTQSNGDYFRYLTRLFQLGCGTPLLANDLKSLIAERIELEGKENPVLENDLAELLKCRELPNDLVEYIAGIVPNSSKTSLLLMLKNIRVIPPLSGEQEMCGKLCNPAEVKEREAALTLALLYLDAEEVEDVLKNIYGNKTECAEFLKSAKTLHRKVDTESGAPSEFKENILIALVLSKKFDVLEKVLEHCGAELDLNVKSLHNESLLELLVEFKQVHLLKMCFTNSKIDFNAKKFLPNKKQTNVAFRLLDIVVKEENAKLRAELLGIFSELIRKTTFNVNCKDENTESLLSRLYTLSKQKPLEFKNEFEYLFNKNEISQKDLNSLSMGLAHLAVERDDYLLLQSLKDRDRSCIREPDKNGDTPLMLALRKGDEKSYEVLKAQDQVKKNKTEETLLMSACVGGKERIIKELLGKEEYREMLQAVDSKGRCVLHYVATKEGLNVLLNYAIDAKNKVANFNINQKDQQGATPLMRAVQNGNSYVVAELIKHGAEVNECTYDGLSPLMVACSNLDLKVVAALLKAPNINVKYRESKTGFSALRIARLHEVWRELRLENKLTEQKEFIQTKESERKAAAEVISDNHSAATICNMLLSNNADYEDMKVAKDKSTIETLVSFYRVLLWTAFRHSFLSVLNLLLVGTKENPIYTLGDSANKYLMSVDATEPLKKLVSDRVLETLDKFGGYVVQNEDAFSIFNFEIGVKNVFFRAVKANSSSVQPSIESVLNNLSALASSTNEADKTKARDEAKKHHQRLYSRYYQLRKAIGGSLYIFGAKKKLSEIKKCDDDLLSGSMISNLKKIHSNNPVLEKLSAVLDNPASSTRNMLLVQIANEYIKKGKAGDFKEVVQLLFAIRNGEVIADVETTYNVVKFLEELEHYKYNVLCRPTLGYIYGAIHWFRALAFSKNFSDIKAEAANYRIIPIDGNNEVHEVKPSYLEEIQNRIAITAGISPKQVRDGIAYGVSSFSAGISTKAMFVTLTSRFANIPAVLQVAVGAAAVGVTVVTIAAPAWVLWSALGVSCGGGAYFTWGRLKQDIYSLAKIGLDRLKGHSRSDAPRYEFSNPSQSESLYLSCIKEILATNFLVTQERPEIVGRPLAPVPEAAHASQVHHNTSVSKPVLIGLSLTLLIGLLALNEFKGLGK